MLYSEYSSKNLSRLRKPTQHISPTARNEQAPPSRASHQPKKGPHVRSICVLPTYACDPMKLEQKYLPEKGTQRVDSSRAYGHLRNTPHARFARISIESANMIA